MQTELIEQWKPIIGYEGLYEVSNFGRVKSLAKTWITGQNAKRQKEETILRERRKREGYNWVVLCKDGKIVNYQVSLLVWDHFGIGKRNGAIIVVDHIDENKMNDRIDNLQLLTMRQNNIKSSLLREKTSQYTGVSWSKVSFKWRSYIKVNGVQKHLGLFEDENIAAQTYQEALNGLG